MVLISNSQFKIYQSEAYGNGGVVNVIFHVSGLQCQIGPMTQYTPLNIANIHNIDLIPATPLNIF